MFARIREDDIDDIRERTNIVDVVSGYIALKKTGKSYKGLCPFHKEKTPSFIVDSDKQLWHCFGCGEGGNVFTFIMKAENLDFPDSVSVLADRLGHTIKYDGVDAAKAQVKRSEKDRLLEAASLAEEYFNYTLTQTDYGAIGRDYLQKRQISESSIEVFKLGLAADKWNGLLSWLAKKGFSDNELVKAGLALRGEKRQGSVYDRFRRRLMFPIRNLRGQVVGFGGRILDDGEPKYLNSPESMLFHKSSLLYGIYEHKADISTSEEAVVVEGYTDVILLRQGGLKNTVATLGTAFGESHVRLLARFSKRVVLLFDGDDAGLAAAERALDYIDDTSADIFVAVLPEGLDPAEYVVRNGKKAMESVISSSVSVVDFCIDRIVQSHDSSSSAGKLKMLGEIVGVLSRLSSPLAKDEYIRKVSQRFDVSREALNAEVKAKQSGTERYDSTSDSTKVVWSGAEAELLKTFVHYPSIAAKRLTDLADTNLKSKEIDRALAVLSGLYKDKVEYGPAEIIDRLVKENIDSSLIGFLSTPISNDDIEQYAKALIGQMRAESMDTEIEALRKRLESIDLDSDEYDIVFRKLVDMEGVKRQPQQ